MEFPQVDCLRVWPFNNQNDTGLDVIDHDLAIYKSVARTGMPSASPLRRFLDEPEWLLSASPAHEVDCSLPLTLFPYSPTGVPQLSGHAGLELQADRRDTSPSSSALESSLTSSARSEFRDSPRPSPHLAVIPYPTLYGQDESIAFSYGGHDSCEEHGSYAIDDCVALHDVQRCADDQPCSSVFEETHAACAPYGSIAQEGYHPISPPSDENSETSHSTPCFELRPTEEIIQRSSRAPDFRRRRAHSSRSMSVSTARINKRPQTNQRSSSYHHSKIGTTKQDCITTAGNRAFTCLLAVYGCPSAFTSKNEWKRHVSTQHMRLGFWRCDQCGANSDRKPNDFNRKDLFIQHVRRMHATDTSRPSISKRSQNIDKESGDEQVLDETAKRCYHQLRSSPEHSCCLFCEQEFHGQGTWDERLEHIGRHFQAQKKSRSSTVDPKNWQVDEMSHAWMVKEGIIISRGAQWLFT